MKLTALLTSARRKYGDDAQLRELPDGRRQVVRYPKREESCTRDESGVEVVAETRGTWAELGVTP